MEPKGESNVVQEVQKDAKTEDKVDLGQEIKQEKQQEANLAF